VYVQISLKSQVAVWLCLLYIKSTVSCFVINCQGPVVHQAPYQMDWDATPAPLLGVLSLTPVTQGIWGLQAVLVEHVSQVACGQGLIQHVQVSPRCPCTWNCTGFWISILYQLFSVQFELELFLYRAKGAGEGDNVRYLPLLMHLSYTHFSGVLVLTFTKHAIVIMLYN